MIVSARATPDGKVTLSLGDRAEIRDLAGARQVVAYPHSDVCVVNGTPGYMHADQLGSVQAIAASIGNLAMRRVTRPFGQMRAWDYGVATPDNAHGRGPSRGLAIAKLVPGSGERYDAAIGPQYLNAR